MAERNELNEKKKINYLEGEVRVLRGRRPGSDEKEYKEMMNYESGKADEEASKFRGTHREPWLNVVETMEPASMPGFEVVKNTEKFRKRIHGKVLDIGAGTCWLSGKLSLLPEVTDVCPVDLSEKFMTTSGLRTMKALGANLDKVTFIASDFNDIPLETESMDCAVLFASMHHSLSPIKTLQEVGRCVKKGGAILILEQPPATIHIRKAREKALKLSENVSEICYTREEWVYQMRAANVGPIETHTLDILSRRGWRRVVRKLFRFFNLEHVFLNPPTYLFIITKR